MYHKKLAGLIIILFALVGFCNVAGYVCADEEIIQQMNGKIEKGELFDVKIINVGDVPETDYGSDLTTLTFVNDALSTENPAGTTAVKCQQYLKVVLSDRPDNAKLMLYFDNVVGNANGEPYGIRLEEDPTVDPDTGEILYTPTTDELSYFMNDHPYPIANGSEEYTLITTGHKPRNFETGAVGENFTSDGRGFTPVFWQVYPAWPEGYSIEDDDEAVKDATSSSDINLDCDYPESWYTYGYEKPYETNEKDLSGNTRANQYRMPIDWWATGVDKYRLDWDWKLDFPTGHFEGDSWISMKDFRTCIYQNGWNGHYPGLRVVEANQSYPAGDIGKRVDENGSVISYDTSGNPANYNWGMREDVQEIIGGDVTSGYEEGYDAYIYLGANLNEKVGQNYTANLYISLEYDTDAVDQDGNPIKDTRILSVPVVCNYQSAREIKRKIKDKNGQESTSNTINFDSGSAGVSAQQYLEVNTFSNIPNDRVVVYIDNTYSGLTYYKFDGSRVVYDANYTPTSYEQAYTHPYPDANHNLTTPDAALYNLYGYTTQDAQKKIHSLLKPTSFETGMILYTGGTSAEVTPVFWRVYPEELYGSSYPTYTDSGSPWDNGGPTAIGWATLLDKYSLEWDWQLAYDANGNSTGHFKVYPTDTSGVDPVTGWMPMKYYRTAIDQYGNLGSYPYSDRKITLPASIYLYFAANYSDVTPGYYGSSRLMIGFENDDE